MKRRGFLAGLIACAAYAAVPVKLAAKAAKRTIRWVRGPWVKVEFDDGTIGAAVCYTMIVDEDENDGDD